MTDTSTTTVRMGHRIVWRGGEWQVTDGSSFVGFGNISDAGDYLKSLTGTELERAADVVAIDVDTTRFETELERAAAASHRVAHPAAVMLFPIGADSPVLRVSCRCGWHVEGPMTDADAEQLWRDHDRDAREAPAS